MEVTKQEFEDIINNSHELVVVDFFTEWCMPCLIISPIIEELAEQMQGVKFVKINLDENQELASTYKVTSIPCLIVFKDGEAVDRIIGAQTKEKIEEKIGSYL